MATPTHPLPLSSFPKRDATGLRRNRWYAGCLVSMPELSRNARVTDVRAPSLGRPPLSSELNPRPPRPAPPSALTARRGVTEAVARSDASASNPPREPTQLATAKPKACPPPLPPAARPSRVTPPPLPPAVHVATELARPVTVEPARPVAVELARPVAVELAPPVFRSTREAEIPDFLDGAARRRRVLWTVLALAGLVLVAAVIATIASHYRPM